MVNANVAFERQREILKSKGCTSPNQLQPLIYIQNWTRPATPDAGDVSGAPVNQSFPSEITLVLGIMSDCTPDTQPANPFILGNQRFRQSFQYNVGQQGLVIANGGQGGLASTIYSQYGDQFPFRELVLRANDVISGIVQSTNASDTAITGTTAFHCLVWKYAQ